MDSSTAYLAGQVVAASGLTILLAATKKWVWVPMPFALLILIWGSTYLMVTHG